MTPEMTKKNEPEPAELLAKFNAGESISPAQTASLIERIKTCVSEEPDYWDFDEIYEVVLALGKLRVLEAAPELERLLIAQEPLTLCLVLETLCLKWDRTEEYLERVMTFAVGAVWDEDLDVQEKAIELLGDYVRKRAQGDEPSKSSVVQRVIETLWQQFASAEEPVIIRKAAYRAIVSASGNSGETNGSSAPDDRTLQSLFTNLPEVKSVDDLGPGFEKEALKKTLGGIH